MRQGNSGNRFDLVYIFMAVALVVGVVVGAALFSCPAGADELAADRAAAYQLRADLAENYTYEFELRHMVLDDAVHGQTIDDDWSAGCVGWTQMAQRVADERGLDACMVQLQGDDRPAHAVLLVGGYFVVDPLAAVWPIWAYRSRGYERIKTWGCDFGEQAGD